MQDIFIELALNPSSYTYECEDTTKIYNGEPVEHEYGRFLVVKCETCSNVTVKGDYHV